MRDHAAPWVARLKAIEIKSQDRMGLAGVGVCRYRQGTDLSDLVSPGTHLSDPGSLGTREFL